MSKVVIYFYSLLQKLSNVYSSYSWIRGDFDSAVPEDVLRNIVGKKLESFIKKVNRHSSTFFLKATEYFPHVSTDSLANGFYQRFDKIQGIRGVYYASTVLSFETMNLALDMAEGFVNKYF